MDLFDKEKVSEGEARSYASEIGAVFKHKSACSGTGIEDLFKSIGCKFLDPNYKEEEEDTGSGSDGKSNKSGGAVKLDANKAKESPKKKDFVNLKNKIIFIQFTYFKKQDIFWIII